MSALVPVRFFCNASFATSHYHIDGFNWHNQASVHCSKQWTSINFSYIRWKFLGKADNQNLGCCVSSKNATTVLGSPPSPRKQVSVFENCLLIAVANSRQLKLYGVVKNYDIKQQQNLKLTRLGKFYYKYPRLETDTYNQLAIDLSRRLMTVRQSECF